MFEPHIEHDKYLYHYTSAETALEKIIPASTLKVGAFHNTNDPKESKSWDFNLACGDSDPSYEATSKAKGIVSGTIQERVKLLCFSKDKSYMDIDPLNHLFSRGFAKPRMWAQYGGNHTGVCFVFEKEKLNVAIGKEYVGMDTDVYQGSVTYQNRPLSEDITRSAYTINYPHFLDVGLQHYVRQHLFTHYRRLFFEKSLDWRDEEEYRWVLVSNKEGNLYLNFGDALAGIVFGENTEEKIISSIVEESRKLGDIEFEQMSWKNCTPWLSFRSQWP